MYYNNKEKNKKKLFFILAVLLITALTLTKYIHSKNNKEEYIIKGNGRIEGRETIVSAKFSGKIISLNVDEGSFVKKGDLMAELDSRSLVAIIEADKAKANEILKQISSTEANIKSAQSDVEFYSKEVARSKSLIKQNFSSQVELEKNINNLDKAVAQLDSLSAEKKALQASHDSLLATIKSKEVDLEYYKIYAPTDGVVLYRLVEDGEIMAASGKMFIMYNPDELFMTIYMPSQKAGQVKLGDEARIKLDAYPNEIFTSKVTFVAKNSEFTPKEVETQEERQKLVFRVKVSLNSNDDRKAMPGMPGDGYIKLDNDEDWPSNLN